MSEDRQRSQIRGVDGRGVSAARSNITLYPVIAAAGLFSSIAVARTLPLGDFALYAIAIAVRGTVQFIADMGTGAASSKAFARMHEAGARAQARRLYGRLIAIRAAMAALLVGAVALVPDFFTGLIELSAAERPFLWFIAVIGALEIAAGLGYYALVGLFRQPVVNRVNLAQGVIQPAAVIAAAVAGLGLWGVLAGVVVGSLTRASVLNLAAIRSLAGLRETGVRLPRLRRDYSTVAVSSTIGKTAAWAHSRQAVTLVVAATASRPQLAIFSLAHDFASQVLTVATSPASGIFLPLFAVQDSAARRRALLRVATRLLSYLTLPSAGLLVVVAPDLVPMLFGDRFSGALPYLYIVLPGLALEMTLSMTATALMMADSRLLRGYSFVKILTVVSFAAYVAVGGNDLLLVTAIMMGVRLASTALLHTAIWRTSAATVDLGRLSGIIAVCLLGVTVAVLVRSWLGDGGASGLAAALAFVLVLLPVVKLSRLVPDEDGRIAARILPPLEPVVRWLVAAR